MGKTSDKKAEKKAKKKIKKYYGEKEAQIKQGAANKRDSVTDEKNIGTRDANIDIGRFNEDFLNVMGDLGVKRDQIGEDFLRNTGRLLENKETDLEDLNHYVSTSSQRTQEDLDVSLDREFRRYDIQKDRNNLDMTAKNQAYSGFGGVRGEIEGRAAAENKDITGAANRTAARSFEDIKRYEFVKSMQIEQEYARGTEDEGTKKERSLTEIMQSEREAGLAKNRGVQDRTNDIADINTRTDNSIRDIDLGESIDIHGNDYGRDTDRALIGAAFDSSRNSIKRDGEYSELFR